jgi:shikimate 5-dehydrogenase
VQLTSFEAFVQKLALADRVKLVHNDFDPAINDRFVGECRRKALVINATGMGKDRPGSPTSDDVQYPEEALVWDLNYRGELLFLSQARRQAEAKRLAISDGWTCFLHGWTQSIQTALDLDTAAKFDIFENCANQLRHPSNTTPD